MHTGERGEEVVARCYIVQQWTRKKMGRKTKPLADDTTHGPAPCTHVQHSTKIHLIVITLAIRNINLLCGYKKTAGDICCWSYRWVPLL
jgi:hypothetical protein